jgi:aminoglycoside phosphotransferase
MLESKLPFELVFDVLRSNQRWWRWWMRRLFLAGFDINLPFFFHPFTPVPCSSLSTYTLRVLQSTNTTSNLSSHSTTTHNLIHSRCCDLQSRLLRIKFPASAQPYTANLKDSYINVPLEKGDIISQGILTEAYSPMTDTHLNVPKPNVIQRCLLLSCINLVRRFRQRKGSVLMLTKDLCVKYGARLDLVEAQTMIYVAENTSIPVPKVYFAFTHKGCTYIFMERIQGEMAAKNWVWRSQASKSKVHENLKKMILELRNLSTQSSHIANVTGGPLYDGRLPGETERFGPFKNVQDLHDHLRNGIHDHGRNDEVNQLIDMHRQDWDGPSFTHGDLSSLNILLRGEDVVGILDWETAGWYPSYWEYTTACQVNPQNSFWRKEIEHFLEPMPEALEMERLRQKYFGDF